MNTFKKAKRFLATCIATSALLACSADLSGDETTGSAANTQSNLQRQPTPNLPMSPASPPGLPPPRQMRSPTPGDPIPQGDVAERRAGSAPCDAAELISATGPALVFNDIQALESPLSLANVLDALAGDANTATGAAAQAAIVQTMLDSFGFTAMVNSDALANYGLTSINVDNRPLENAINAAQLVLDMKPSATFNRLDLASSDGSDCGEQRVIYSLDPSSVLKTVPFQDFTLIFEARYPNPSPADGLAGCQPIADFYASLADPGLTNAQRAAAISDLFLNGVSVTNSVTGDTVALPAVVTIANYQGGMGQIRTNQFLDLNWQLREFRTNIALDGTVEFVPDTIKGNPITALYNANAATAAGIPNAMRDDFVDNLLDVQVPLLVQPELLGLTDTDDILTGFEPAFDTVFSQFTSDSQNTSDDPASAADQALKDAIDDTLTNDLGLASSTVNSTHVLNRLGAMTCGGCHQFSANRPVSPTVDWPAMSFSFKHVAFNGNLSPALINTFLPKRRTFMLDTWLCHDAEPECQTDEDCFEDGLVCVDGECVEEPVDPCDDIVCMDGFTCVEGDCIEDPDTGCDDNADCSYGQVCENGECVDPQPNRCRSDDDCPGTQICVRGACVEPVERDQCEAPAGHMTGPGRMTGTTTTGTQMYAGTCGGAGSESVVAFSPSASGTVCISTVGSRLDTVLHVREHRCQSSRAQIACNDDMNRATTASQVQIDVSHDLDYYIFIDSNMRRPGPWGLTVRAGACRRMEARPVRDDAQVDAADDTSTAETGDAVDERPGRVTSTAGERVDGARDGADDASQDENSVADRDEQDEGEGNKEQARTAGQSRG